MTETIKKWEFVTEDTLFFEGRTLIRIRALVDYPNGRVKAGELGGYIEKPENLGDWGWVGDNAKVFDDGRVCNDGLVRDNARVYDRGQVSGSGYVCGEGLVRGNGRVYGEGLVCDDAKVFDNGQVYGDGMVCGSGQVYGEGKVSGRGIVSGYACVSGYGYVEDNDDIIVFDNVGSEKSSLTAHRQEDGSINLVRGCFSGSIEEFTQRSAIRHALLPKVKKQYELIIEVIKHNFDMLD